METPLKTEKQADQIKFHWSKIKIEEGSNPRQIFEDIESLADSIQENGILVPLRGRRDKEDSSFVIISSGERRFRAIRLLIDKGIDPGYIPFILEPKGVTKEQRLLNEFISNDGRSLKPIEEAGLFKQLVNFGYSPAEIAKKTARSITHINNLLSLTTIPKKVENYILEGKITENTVIQIIKNSAGEQEIVSMVEEALLNVEIISETTGKAPKKATIKHVNSEKVKSPIQILTELYCLVVDIDTVAAKAFVEVFNGAKEKHSAEELAEILSK